MSNSDKLRDIINSAIDGHEAGQRDAIKRAVTRPMIEALTAAEAVDAAKQAAAREGERYTVWRSGDRFVAVAGHLDVPGAWRPVASYDPDGTEHC
jgi:hypothetical protein